MCKNSHKKNEDYYVLKNMKLSLWNFCQQCGWQGCKNRTIWPTFLVLSDLAVYQVVLWSSWSRSRVSPRRRGREPATSLPSHQYRATSCGSAPILHSLSLQHARRYINDSIGSSDNRGNKKINYFWLRPHLFSIISAPAPAIYCHLKLYYNM